MCVRDGKEGSVVVKNYRRDCSSFWNFIQIAPMKDAEGRITLMVGVQCEVSPPQQRSQSDVDRENEYTVAGGSSGITSYQIGEHSRKQQKTQLHQSPSTMLTESNIRQQSQAVPFYSSSGPPATRTQSASSVGHTSLEGTSQRDNNTDITHNYDSTGVRTSSWSGSKDGIEGSNTCSESNSDTGNNSSDREGRG